MDKIIRRSHSVGDILSVEPVIRAVAKTGNVAVRTKNPDVLANHPSLSTETELVDPQLFDLDGSYEQQLHRLREDVYLDICGVSLPEVEKMPRIYLTDAEKSYGRSLLSSGLWVIIDIGYKSKADFKGTFAGKSYRWKRAFWRPEEWQPLCAALNKIGYKTVQTSNESTDCIPNIDLDLRRKTNIRQFFGLANACSFYIGIECGTLHVCQALGLPGIGIFHPNHPAASLLPFGSKMKPTYRRANDPLDWQKIMDEVTL